MTTPDQRRFPRVEFFLVPDANEQLPVWVFKPESETVGRAGVVVNLSGGGLQIAVGAQEPLQARHYELRLLRIPAVYAVALWLHAPDGDLLIPVSPAPPPLRANEPYDAAAFSAALRPLAESAMRGPGII